MGLFGRSVVNETTSKLGDGTKRITKRFDDGSSEDWNYKDGVLIGVDCHESRGKTHSHEPGHGWLGPFKGTKK